MEGQEEATEATGEVEVMVEGRAEAVARGAEVGSAASGEVMVAVVGVRGVGEAWAVAGETAVERVDLAKAVAAQDGQLPSSI